VAVEEERGRVDISPKTAVYVIHGGEEEEGGEEEKEEEKEEEIESRM